MYSRGKEATTMIYAKPEISALGNAMKVVQANKLAAPVIESDFDEMSNSYETEE
jgi:hypothetical protein